MKHVVLLGNTRNKIVHQMASHLLERNTTITIIDGVAGYEHENLHHIKSRGYLTLLDRVLLKALPKVIVAFDFIFSSIYFISSFQFRKLREFNRLPNLKISISNMLIQRRVLASFEFDYALCLNVYFFGFGAMLCNSRRFIAQPWGSDVNKYGVSSPIRFFFMRRCLKAMAYIAPAGRSVIPFMIETYGIQKEKFVFLPPIVDSNIFGTIEKKEIIARKNKIGINDESIIFFSCRRFAEGWGPDLIRKLFLKLCQRIPNAFFIVLSGYESNTLMEEFMNEIPAEKRHQFLFLDKEITLTEFSYYCQISDFTVSAMTNRDMQSSSIMQSVSCGAYPILKEQDEYQIMVKEGFDSLLFKQVDEALVDDIGKLISTPGLLDQKRELNRDYFLKRKNSLDYVTILNSLDFH